MIKNTMYALSVCALIAVACCLFLYLQGSEPSLADGGADAESVDLQSVQLPASKLPSAGVASEIVRKQSLQPTRVLPGRLDYDQDRHIAIKTACNGILTEVKLHPGQSVTRGQTLAIVSSPEVGAARSDVRQRIATRELARNEYKRQQTISDAVEAIVQMIRNGKSPEQIDSELKNDGTGDYRGTLIEAYTRSRIASQTAAASRSAAQRGVIAGRIQQERESEMQAAAASLKSLTDQAMFDTRKQCKVAETSLEESSREVDISLQRLNALLGPAAKQATESSLLETQNDSISTVQIVSPIDGTIEERVLAATERVNAGDTIFIVADTSRLWATANVRGNDWQAINAKVGQTVSITTPAIDGLVLTGKIIIIGRRVDPATNAAPLIAALDNCDSRLRPGMFIRMTVPTGPERQGIAVPEQSVVVHEGKPFVFVAENENNFHRVDVQTGAVQEGKIEITSGLQEGQRVATAGVFKLKSELLLAGEE